LLPQGPFIDPATEPMPEKAILLVAPVTTFFILALVCIGLRLWSKKIKKTSLRFSDYSVLVAAVFAAGYLALTWLSMGNQIKRESGKRGGGTSLLSLLPS
jgi:hypothetical protein